jgi:Polysaccharide deacetylase/Chitobiase/beta-hexosaminidase C-terminal domain
MVRRGIAILLGLTLGWAVLGGTSSAAADTIVSLTFDDGNSDQLAAQPLLAEHGMAGTFYIITDRVSNRPGVFTWDDIASLYADGNEIAGHTTDHVSLTDETPEEATAAVCGGRQALLAHGYPQVSFAYPRGDHDATTEGVVEECGYVSGRALLSTSAWTALGAETIPPGDPFAIGTPGTIDKSDSLEDMENWITTAEAVDGTNGSDDAWVPLVFHHLCDPAATGSNCDDPSGVAGQYVTPSDFDALLGWLQTREPTTRVETMARAMDPNPPTSEILCNGASCESSLYAGPVSVTLSATDTGGAGVSGVQNIRYTTDGSTPNGSSPIYSGPIGVGSTTTIRFRAEDNARNVESATHSQTISISPPTQGDGGGTLGALVSKKSLPNGTAKLVFAVGGPGTLGAVDASGTGDSAVASKRQRARIKPASTFVAEAGDATLVIRASKAGKRILRRKGKLTLPVRVTFTPLTGSPESRTVKLKLRLKRRHSA